MTSRRSMLGSPSLLLGLFLLSSCQAHLRRPASPAGSCTSTTPTSTAGARTRSSKDFDFSQRPRPPLPLPVHPRRTLTG